MYYVGFVLSMIKILDADLHRFTLFSVCIGNAVVVPLWGMLWMEILERGPEGFD